MAEADDIIASINPKYFDKAANVPAPIFKNALIYDSTAETLEPVYFWILDFIQGMGTNVEKIVDNFIASPGSGYFAELSARATRMQEEGMKILGMVNTVLKSVINLIYDLKEWEIRLKDYERASSKEAKTKETGTWALKARWLQNVDTKRGAGSIDMMTHQYGFTTLRDAFMVAESAEAVDKMDINDRVKRILKPRIAEFLEWWKRSEAELKKRYEIERGYLRSQVSTLRLYTRWVKPYLKAAEQLRMREAKPELTPSLVNAFNTMLLELSLLGTKKIAVKDEAQNKRLPERFARIAPKLRNYYACVLIDFTFRGVPRRFGPEVGHYVHGGRVDVRFRAYALNEDERLLLHKRLEEDDLHYALDIAKGITEESLEGLRQDIEYFLKKERLEVEEAKKKKKEVGPFEALASGITSVFKKKEKEEEKPELKLATEKEEAEKKEEAERAAKLEKEGIKKDSYEESVVRAFAETQAAAICYKIYDTYKKAHGMASFPVGEEYIEEILGKIVEKV